MVFLNIKILQQAQDDTFFVIRIRQGILYDMVFPNIKILQQAQDDISFVIPTERQRVEESP